MSEPTLPDTSSWTLDQFQDAINQLNSAYYLKQQQQADTQEARKEAIAGAVTDLQNLLGAPDEPKGLTTIRGVRQHTPEEMVSGAAVSFPLIFAALEILTDTTLDLAKAVRDS